MEFVHPVDVATAVANSVTAEVNGKILYLGGGKDCQMTNSTNTAAKVEIVEKDSKFRLYFRSHLRSGVMHSMVFRRIYNLDFFFGSAEIFPS